MKFEFSNSSAKKMGPNGGQTQKNAPRHQLGDMFKRGRSDSKELEPEITIRYMLLFPKFQSGTALRDAIPFRPQP